MRTTLPRTGTPSLNAALTTSGTWIERKKERKKVKKKKERDKTEITKICVNHFITRNLKIYYENFIQHESKPPHSVTQLELDRNLDKTSSELLTTHSRQVKNLIESVIYSYNISKSKPRLAIKFKAIESVSSNVIGARKELDSLESVLFSYSKSRDKR